MGIGSLVGGVVGFALGGPPGAALGAAAGGTKQGQAVVSTAGKVVGGAADVFVEAVEGFGDVIWSGTTAIVDAVGDLAMSAVNVVHGTIALRSLRASEVKVLKDVFGDSVPYHRVVVTSLEGIGARPLTLPGTMITTLSWAIPGVGPLLAIYSHLRDLNGKYLLLMGPQGYNRGLDHPFDNIRGGQTLVHEMAHVWQGHHGAGPWAYVIESVLKQCSCGLKGQPAEAAYSATPGQQWKEYGVEQQARLVEMWYVGAGLGRRKGTVPTGGAPSWSGISSWIRDATDFAILDAYVKQIIQAGDPNRVMSMPTSGFTGTATSALSGTGAVSPNRMLGSGGGTSATLLKSQVPQATRDAARQQAEAFLATARQLRATGLPAMTHQAMLLEQQAAQ